LALCEGEKMIEFQSKCPVCGGRVIITSYKCVSCNSKVEGSFQPNEFSRLSSEDLEFLRLYLKNRGNLTKVAEKLKISYPTAHSYFSRLLKNLGYSVQEESRYSSILEKLEKGEIDFSTAISLIKNSGEEKI